MKYLQKVTLALFVMLSVSGCEKTEGLINEKEEGLIVYVEVKNSTGENLSSLLVNIDGLEQSYSDLKNAEISEVNEFPENYLASSISFSINERSFQLNKSNSATIYPGEKLAIWEAPENGVIYTYDIFPNPDPEFSDSDLAYLFSISSEK